MRACCVPRAGSWRGSNPTDVERRTRHAAQKSPPVSWLPLLLILFISPVVVKLKDVALSVVVLIGMTMMLIDLWQSLRSKDD